MTDLRTLTDAFTELERRADAAPVHADTAPTTRIHPQRGRRPVLIAATVVATLAVATGATLLAQSGDSGHEAAAPPASHTATGRHQHTATPAAFHIPTTAKDLTARFRRVLGDTATITVTDTGSAKNVKLPPEPSRAGSPAQPKKLGTPTVENNGAAIVGMMTAHGTTGGYDMQIFRDRPGDKAWCEDPDRATCSVRRLPDGSSLAVSREPLPGSSNGVTYAANLIRADGVEFLMHVSNERDPKGASNVLAENPPLTVQQMVEILTSDRW